VLHRRLCTGHDDGAAMWVAPVLSQPSMPASVGATRAAGIDASTGESRLREAAVRRRKSSLIGLRFKSDKAVPDARFENLSSRRSR